MPMLYALGQHQALLAVQSQLLPNERLMAFHDDVYAVSEPERTCKLHNILRQELWDHSRIQINAGKTQIWNRGGHVPTDHDVLLAAARREDPEAQVWFGDLQVPAALRGIRVLGTPLGTSEFVQAQLQATVESHEVLLSRIPVVPDLQSAFLLLLFCASSTATYYLRVCNPTFAERFAQQHDSQVWQCFLNLIGQLPHQATWELGSLPLHLGGLGIRSASRTAHAAYWGSWADCLSTIRERHSNIAEIMSEALSNPPATAVHLQGVVQSRSSLATVGFTTPDWNSLLQGLRPRQPELDELDPGVPSHGWQFFAALSVEHHFRSHSVWPRLTPTEQALLRSQSGPMAGLPFSSIPTSSLSRFPPQLFRVLLLRRLLASFAPCFSHLPVWPSTRRPWPPPCSVFEGRGAGESRFLCGERCCKGVSRSGSSRVSECVRQGLGLAGRPARWSAVGGCRRWASSFRRCSIGN